ncbi:MAG: hypothetical protein JNJ54_09890 [Myxococcaceae bacterium]|nr:hypothetical protein [Myxococcaceae bacterium]
MRFALAAVFLVAPPAFAFPIPPQTLWELTRDAEAIVVAHVDAVKALPRADKDTWGPSHLATLSVNEALKGAVKGVVEVPFHGNMLCPAPPDYREGETVVAFLSRDKDTWDTVALSYGTRYPGDARSLAQTKHVIELAARLLRGTSEPPMGWLLLAIAHPSTRWDGLFALQHESDELHSHYGRRAPSEPLSPITLAAVESAFLEQPSFDATVPMMLNVLASRPAPAITQLTVDILESVMRANPAPWWTDEAMTLLEARLGATARSHPAGADPLDAELERVGAMMTFEERERALQARWEALKVRAKLSPQVRDDFQRPHPSRTGGQTPP